MIPDEDPVEIGNLDSLNFYSDRVFPEAMAQEVQTGARNTTLQCEFSSGGDFLRSRPNKKNDGKSKHHSNKSFDR